MMIKGGCIYILTNKNNTTLYTGVTSNLKVRLFEHIQSKYPNSFTSKYGLNKLVYYEVFQRIEDAIKREKQIKSGNRLNKEKIISSLNPHWKDLSGELGISE